ncbi:MAG TPA: AAA family ATPase [Devosia sp.]|nr:AAA family ATPase [Devosia sp.]
MPFVEGQEVYHAAFGVGTVESSSKERCNVHFIAVGARKVPNAQLVPSTLENIQQVVAAKRRGMPLRSAAPTGPVRAGPIIASPYAWVDPATIPAREWLYAHHLIRKFVSVTVAPGGVGKSSLLIAEALAMVSGRSLLAQWVGSKPLRVWLWNLEDPMDELQRRIQAACIWFGLNPQDLGDRLYVDSGRIQSLCTAIAGRDGAVIQRPVVDAVTAQMIEQGIDVLIVDPFVSSHSVGENDNNAIDMVAKEWGRVADKTNAAVSLVHHTRKQEGVEITADSSRGAKALIDAARDGRAINRMSKDEAEQAGVSNPRLYFRAYSDKANLAPPSDKSDWYKLEGVSLPNGDHVGVVTPWQWPDPFADVSTADLAAVQREIQGHQYRENSQANDWVGFAVARVLELDANDKSDRQKIKSMLREWVKNGVLRVSSILDEKGKSRPIVEVGEWVTA